MSKILTTHAGSLIRPPEVLGYLGKIASGQPYDEAAYADSLRSSVSEIVRHQLDVGLDVVDDGELGKASWITYLYERVSGLELRPSTREGASMLPPSRDRQAFPGAYARLDALDEAATRQSNAGGDADASLEAAAVEWVCTGPLSYDRSAVDRDIANLKAALAEHGEDVEGFLPVVAPASAY